LPSVSPKGVQTFPFVQMFFTMTASGCHGFSP
jgi:hypothetical protein